MRQKIVLLFLLTLALPAAIRAGLPDRDWRPLLTANGSTVFYVSSHMNALGEYRGNLMVYDLDDDTLRRVVIPGFAGSELSTITDISADGRYVAFLTSGAQCSCMYVLDREQDDLQALNVTAEGIIDGFYPYETGHDAVDLSSDGRYAAFIATGENLVQGEDNGLPDLFLLDRQENSLTRPLPASNGELVWRGLVSDDGRFLAVDASLSDLTTQDANGSGDVFLLDLETDRVTLVSRRFDSPDSTGNERSQLQDMTPDGRFIIFWSGASDLVEDDTNDADDVFLYDREADSVTRLSVLLDGVEFDAGSHHAWISSDGRFVTLLTMATNVAEEVEEPFRLLVLLDRETGEFTPIVNNAGIADINADGSVVAFTSSADGLVEGDTDGQSDVFIYERETGEIRLVSGDR